MKIENIRKLKLGLSKFLTTTGFLVLLTSINAFLFKFVDYRALGMIYLMGITTASLYIKNYNIILATVLGAICWNVIFIPPRFTFAINAPEDWALLVLYLVAGVVIGSFMKRLKVNEDILKAERNRATQLYSITKALSTAEDLRSLIYLIQGEVQKIFNCPSSIILHETPGIEYDQTKAKRSGSFSESQVEKEIIDQVLRTLKPAGRFTTDFGNEKGLYYPLIGEKKIIGILALDVSSYSHFLSDQWLILDTMARQLSTGLLRDRLEKDFRGKLVGEESERIYKTLLNSVSHELRTPLSTIKGFSAALHDSEILRDPGKITSIADEISQGVERLDYVVQNLLDMSRLESGNLKLSLDYADVIESINSAVKKVKKYHGDKLVSIKSEPDIPLVYVDYFLIEQTFENVIRNAFAYTPADTPLEIKVLKEPNFVKIIMTDHGTGIKSENPNDIFNKFYRETPRQSGGVGLGLSICKSIMELHHGSISVENMPANGASFTFRIPRELDREVI